MSLQTISSISDPATYQAEVSALLNFLGVSSPDSWRAVWEASNVAYRQTRKIRTTVESISAWVRAAELLADQINVAEFDENRLRSSLSIIRRLTRTSIDTAIEEMRAVCANVGMAVVIVPELPHTGISGCALLGNSPSPRMMSIPVQAVGIHSEVKDGFGIR